MISPDSPKMSDVALFGFTDVNNSNKKRILFILHHWGGGVEDHTADLIKSIESLYTCYTLQVEKDQMILTEYNNRHILRYIFLLSHPTRRGLLYDEECNNLYRKIINTFHINIIHIQHLMLHTLDIIDIAKEQNIPLFVTFHDYYAVCPRIFLLDERWQCCHKKNEAEKCSICLAKFPTDFINTWRESYQKVINSCDLLIAPNRSVFEILKEYYDIPNDKSLAIEHGHKNELIDIFRENNLSDSDRNDIINKFHIAFMGFCIKHKGCQVFYDAARSAKLKNKIRWSVIGDSPVFSSPNVHVYGKYNNLRELESFLKTEKVDLIFLPSICPETFSYTLSEAWAFGIPVLVSDRGALRERVERLGGGWTVDVSDYKKVEQKILAIMGSLSEYKSIKESIKKISLKTSKEMAAEYIGQYENKLSSNPVFNNDFIFKDEEIIESITRIKKDTVVEIENISQKDVALYKRFFRCLKQNGLSYTIRRTAFILRICYIRAKTKVLLAWKV